jgi:hypothetical protein
MAINKPSVAGKYVRLHISIFAVLFIRNTGSFSSVFDALERQLKEIYYRNRTDGNLLHFNALYDFNISNDFI